MIIYIKKPRKDNKAIVSYRYDNGRIINKLTKLEDIPYLLVKYSDETIMGYTQLLRNYN